MTPATIFSFTNMAAMLMWLLMVFLPKWKVSRFLIQHKVVPILLSLVYVVFIIKSILIGGMMDFGSLESVMQLFTEENAVLAGWVHYLAFDLLIGMWIIKENEHIGIPHIILSLCLVCTFMFGPVGFLLFTIIRKFKA